MEEFANKILALSVKLTWLGGALSGPKRPILLYQKRPANQQAASRLIHFYLTF
jgi:hypothetical protein